MGFIVFLLFFALALFLEKSFYYGKKNFVITKIEKRKPYLVGERVKRYNPLDETYSPTDPEKDEFYTSPVSPINDKIS